MSKNFRPLMAFLILTIVTLACDLPIPVPVPPPQGGATPTPPFSPEDVGTVVAWTLTAAAPGSPETGDATATFLSPTLASPSPPGATLLPHSFYYLGTDSAGLFQVFRIEPDGVTRRQITS